jgi:hypothetical protein
MKTERTAEEWGRVAVSLPGWRWMPGMSFGYKPDRRGIRISDVHGPHFRVRCDDGVMQGTCRTDGEVVLVSPTGKVCEGSQPWPHPDDPATEGCMLRLLGRPLYAVEPRGPAWWVTLALLDHPDSDEDGLLQIRGSTVGRACIAAAEAIGRWPGGEG